MTGWLLIGGFVFFVNVCVVAAAWRQRWLERQAQLRWFLAGKGIWPRD